MSNGYLIDSGLNRDTVLDLVDRVNALETKLANGYVVARGRIITNGVGGFTTNLVVGCQVTISGTLLRITFDSPRSTTNYSVSAIRSTLAPNYFVSSNYALASVDLQVRDDAGGSLSVATNVIAVNFVVIDSD